MISSCSQVRYKCINVRTLSVTDLPIFLTTQLPGSGLNSCLCMGNIARTPECLFTKHAGRRVRVKAAIEKLVKVFAAQKEREVKF